MKGKTETQAVQLPKQQIQQIRAIIEQEPRYTNVAEFYRQAAGNEIQRIQAVKGASVNWGRRVEKQVRASD